MAFLRARQRVITGLTPHQGNKRFIIPKRLKQQVQRIPGTTAFWDFTQGTLTDEIGNVTLDFARTTVGTFFGTDRLLTTAAINAPRYDHRSDDALALGIWSEKARTVISRWSEDLTNAVYNASEMTVTANAGQDPTGAGGADLCVPSVTDTTSHRVFQDTNIAVQADHTASIFFRNGGYNFARILVGAFGVTIDLTLGIITNTSGILLDSGVRADGVGGFQVTISGNLAAGNARMQISVYETQDQASFAGDGVSGAFAWGYNLTEGLDRSSYTKAEGADALRDADLCDTADISWYAQNAAGTLYSNAEIPGVDPGGTKRTICSIGTTSAQFAHTVTTQAQQAQSRYTGGAASGLNTRSNLYGPGVFVKVATAVDLNDMATAWNGSAVIEDTSVAFNVHNGFTVGADAAGAVNPFNGHIRQIAYNLNRLPDNVLQAITA